MERGGETSGYPGHFQSHQHVVARYRGVRRFSRVCNRVGKLVAFFSGLTEQILACRAIRGGANRLELCGNLGLGGGTTPSIGLFKAVRRLAQNHQVPVMVMIRPRVGDFSYTPFEMDVMLEDMRAFKHAGADGFVFGVVTPEGRIDIDRTFM